MLLFLDVSSDKPNRSVQSGSGFTYPKERKSPLDGYSCAEEGKGSEYQAAIKQHQDENRRKKKAQMEHEEKIRLEDEQKRDHARRRAEEYRRTGAQRRDFAQQQSTGISSLINEPKSNELLYFYFASLLRTFLGTKSRALEQSGEHGKI